ncbi:unnamed protein product [Euphydryas editha]|uniref:Maturase K n=1 Tax=Euphydryas editha TaxID=104508 RepID=A0AAU9TT06_EUPED|nr:unnamed protein product [Euphydryas editha]
MQNHIVHLQFEDPSLRDYVLYSIVGNFIRGNFTPTSFTERPCRDEKSLPYFVPKHTRAIRSKHIKTKLYNEDYSYRTKSESEFDEYFFKPRFRSYSRVERSLYKKLRYRFLPVTIISGPLEGRTGVVLQWSLTDVSRLESQETSVVFR